jgi:hypothetical protein
VEERRTFCRVCEPACGLVARVEGGALVGLATLAFDADLLPGVVALTHGWGHRSDGMRVAGRHPGVNANRLLPTGPGSYEVPSNQAFMTGVPVEVDAA